VLFAPTTWDVVPLEISKPISFVERSAQFTRMLVPLATVAVCPVGAAGMVGVAEQT
jgi:hypothetical protein